MKVIEKNNEIYLEYKGEEKMFIGVDGQINLKNIHELIKIKDIDSKYIEENLSFDESINKSIIEGLGLFMKNVFRINDVITDKDI